jgi:hypothetical protein
MAILKLMPDFGCFPIWIMGENGYFENIDPAQLSISETLRKQLYHFGKQYDQTLNQNYPPDSRFPSEKDVIEFEHSEISIWQELIREVGNLYEVVYFSVFAHRLYSDLQQYKAAIAQKTGND